MTTRNARDALLLTLVISTFTASFARAEYLTQGLLISNDTGLVVRQTKIMFAGNTPHYM
ncbi:hypothetical protein Brsp05_03444 [Brucella sp. NBRC 12953]